MSGQPSVVADLSAWNFSVHPSDAEFVFDPPKDTMFVGLKTAANGTPAKSKGVKP
jgi:hypothetical protein